MAKNKNYYIAFTAEVDSNTKISGSAKLAPGCDRAWLEDELRRRYHEQYGIPSQEIIITSLSEISRGLYNRLTNNEEN